MTQEEKAKAYDKALELARVAAFNGHQSLMEDIFPELKESEDEKIRKELIDIVAKSPITFAFEDKNKVLSWLEKQGEQKSTIEMKSAEESLGIDSETYNKIVDECIYGEQKPQRMVSAEAKEALYDKPACAWSEEDDVMIKVFDSIIRYIVEVVDKDVLERFGTNREELFSWLKSLKQRIGG